MIFTFMQNIYRFLASCILIVTLSSKSVAQSAAFFPLGSVVAAMPEVKNADKELETYQKILFDKGQEMVKKFQDESNRFLQELEAGNVSPLKQQEQQEAFEKKRQEILDYEKEVSQKLEVKRNELLQPLFDRVITTTNKVAAEKGIGLVYDVSVFNSILYADDAYDIESLVRSRLGIPVEKPDAYRGGTAMNAYVNSTELLAKLPEVKQADDDLAAFQQKLLDNIKARTDQLQKYLLDITQRVERGELSPQQQQAEEEKFRKQQEDILNLQANSESQLTEKRNSLFQPIYKKINTAISVVAKQQHLQFVFEQGVALFGSDNLNITYLVQKQLGLAAGTGNFSGGNASVGVTASEQLLAAMPDVKVAEANMDALREYLGKKGQAMVDQLQKDYVAIQEKIDKGLLSPQQQEREAVMLKKRENEIKQYEMDMQEQLNKKRYDWLQPILDKLNAAIKNTALEKGHAIVVDKNIIIYHHPSLNITEPIKRKLGL